MDWKYILTSFSGRLNRQPFWLGLVLVVVVELVVFYAVYALFGTTSVPTEDAMTPGMSVSPIGWLILGIVYIGVIWAGLAMQIKRWHDRDKSGWWCLIGLVPVIGGLWVLIECGFLRGTEGPNRFGPDPLAN
jgi:uncharacterized membrane protein YhaH (DUF805 family)